MIKQKRLTKMAGNEFAKKVLSGERDFSWTIFDGRNAEGRPKPLLSQDKFTALQEYLKAQDLQKSPMDLSFSQFHCVNLNGIYIPHTIAHGVNITGFSDFSNADLRQAEFSSRYDTDCSIFYLTNLIAKFNGANLEGVDFSNADLGSSQFVGSNLTGANFYRINGDHYSFRDANLSSAKFEKAFLNSASLCGADVKDADFRHSFFYFTQLEGIRNLDLAKNLDTAVFHIACVSPKERDLIRARVLESWNGKGHNAGDYHFGEGDYRK